MDGDHLHVDLEVAPGASPLLSSQGFTRVYRSPRGCRNELDARVGEGGLLALVPDPTVCFADARYTQRQDIQLAPDASLVLMDLVNAGRSANGERWACSSFSSIRVHQQGRALFHGRWLLEPLCGHLPERPGRFDALGIVLLIGPALAAAREAPPGRAPCPSSPRRAHLLHRPSGARGPHPPGGGHLGRDPAPLGPGVAGPSSLPTRRRPWARRA